VTNEGTTRTTAAGRAAWDLALDMRDTQHGYKRWSQLLIRMARSNGTPLQTTAGLRAAHNTLRSTR
jgi:hypothetical protein